MNRCDSRHYRMSPSHRISTQCGLGRPGRWGAILLCWIALPLLGGETTAVPNLAGERVDIARQLATLADLKSVVGAYQIAAHNWRDDLRPGVVYLQSAQPGDPLPRKSHIALWTFVRAAEGAPIVTMPDLRGLTASAAAERVKDLGLATMAGIADGLQDGATVADQFPSAGDSLIVGTSVHLTWTNAVRVE